MGRDATLNTIQPCIVLTILCNELMTGCAHNIDQTNTRTHKHLSQLLSLIYSISVHSKCTICTDLGTRSQGKASQMPEEKTRGTKLMPLTK